MCVVHERSDWGLNHKSFQFSSVAYSAVICKTSCAALMVYL